MGKAVQQGMFLLRSARPTRVGEKRENKNGQGPSRLGPGKCLYQSLHVVLVGIPRSNLCLSLVHAFSQPISSAGLRGVRRALLLLILSLLPSSLEHFS